MNEAGFNDILVAKGANALPLIALKLLFDPARRHYAIIAWTPEDGWQQTAWKLSPDCCDFMDALERCAQRLLGRSSASGRANLICSYSRVADLRETLLPNAFELTEPPAEPSAGEPRAV